MPPSLATSGVAGLPHPGTVHQLLSAALHTLRQRVRQLKDFGTYTGRPVTYGGGVQVLSTQLLPRKTSSGRFLCTAVSMSNSTPKAVSFNPFDWKLQNPAGVIREPEFGGSEDQLRSGELAAGGSVAGDVCFEFDGSAPPTGTWVVLMEPSSFSGERIGWVNRFGEAPESSSPSKAETPSGGTVEGGTVGGGTVGGGSTEGSMPPSVPSAPLPAEQGQG